jgi:hypothetical protein
MGSMASTGESSPVNTVSSDSTSSLPGLSHDDETRGRQMGRDNPKLFSDSYQEFVSQGNLPHFAFTDQN